MLKNYLAFISNTKFDEIYITINRHPEFPHPTSFHYGQTRRCFQRHMGSKLLMIPIQKSDSNLLMMDDLIHQDANELYQYTTNRMEVHTQESRSKKVREKKMAELLDQLFESHFFLSYLARSIFPHWGAMILHKL
jgi:hypothetical protein